MKRTHLGVVLGMALTAALTGTAAGQTVLLEDFEAGNLDAWTVVNGNGNAMVSGDAAFSGDYGVEFFSNPPTGWYYRDDIQTSAGNVYTAFVRTTHPDANQGRMYLGADAHAANGAIVATFAPNTGDLLLQDLTGWSFNTIEAVSVNIQPDTWYQLDLNWVGAGQAQARLWDENRTTIIAETGIHNVPEIGGGGIAFRGFGTGVNHLDDIWQNIPAPGALALLGLAGLIGRRRRN